MFYGGHPLVGPSINALASFGGTIPLDTADPASAIERVLEQNLPVAPNVLRSLLSSVALEARSVQDLREELNRSRAESDELRHGMVSKLEEMDRWRTKAKSLEAVIPEVVSLRQEVAAKDCTIVHRDREIALLMLQLATAASLVAPKKLDG